jgi:ABC-2 type transport system ATP-binding protein
MKIEVQNVSFSYRKGFFLQSTEALHSIDVVFADGKTTGIVGPNGAGKSTLIHLLIGLRKPSKGKILVGGLDPAIPASRKQLGFLPERPYYPDFLTGQEFLVTQAQLSGLSKKSAVEASQEWLETVGLTAEKSKIRLKEYSKGMLQRVGIAQALIHDPSLVVLDEPMSGLDPIGRTEIRDLILRLKKRNITLLFSSHILSDIESLCDEVLVIVQGKKAAFGSYSAKELESYFDQREFPKL